MEVRPVPQLSNRSTGNLGGSKLSGVIRFLSATRKAQTFVAGSSTSLSAASSSVVAGLGGSGSRAGDSGRPVFQLSSSVPNLESLRTNRSSVSPRSADLHSGVADIPIGPTDRADHSSLSNRSNHSRDATKSVTDLSSSINADNVGNLKIKDLASNDAANGSHNGGDRSSTLLTATVTPRFSQSRARLALVSRGLTLSVEKAVAFEGDCPKGGGDLGANAATPPPPLRQPAMDSSPTQAGPDDSSSGENENQIILLTISGSSGWLLPFGVVKWVRDLLPAIAERVPLPSTPVHRHRSRHHRARLDQLDSQLSHPSDRQSPRSGTQFGFSASQPPSGILLSATATHEPETGSGQSVRHRHHSFLSSSTPEHSHPEPSRSPSTPTRSLNDSRFAPSSPHHRSGGLRFHSSAVHTEFNPTTVVLPSISHTFASFLDLSDSISFSWTGGQHLRQLPPLCSPVTVDEVLRRELQSGNLLFSLTRRLIELYPNFLPASVISGFDTLKPMETSDVNPFSTIFNWSLLLQILQRLNIEIDAKLETSLLHDDPKAFCMILTKYFEWWFCCCWEVVQRGVRAIRESTGSNNDHRMDHSVSCKADVKAAKDTLEILSSHLKLLISEVDVRNLRAFLRGQLNRETDSIHHHLPPASSSAHESGDVLKDLRRLGDHSDHRSESPTIPSKISIPRLNLNRSPLKPVSENSSAHHNGTYDSPQLMTARSSKGQNSKFSNLFGICVPTDQYPGWVTDRRVDRIQSPIIRTPVADGSGFSARTRFVRALQIADADRPVVESNSREHDADDGNWNAGEGGGGPDAKSSSGQSFPAMPGILMRSPLFSDRSTSDDANAVSESTGGESVAASAVYQRSRVELPPLGAASRSFASPPSMVSSRFSTAQSVAAGSSAAVSEGSRYNGSDSNNHTAPLRPNPSDRGGPGGIFHRRFHSDGATHPPASAAPTSSLQPSAPGTSVSEKNAKPGTGGNRSKKSCPVPREQEPEPAIVELCEMLLFLSAEDSINDDGKQAELVSHHASDENHRVQSLLENMRTFSSWKRSHQNRNSHVLGHEQRRRSVSVPSGMCTPNPPGGEVLSGHSADALPVKLQMLRGLSKEQLFSVLLHAAQTNTANGKAVERGTSDIRELLSGLIDHPKLSEVLAMHLLPPFIRQEGGGIGAGKSESANSGSEPGGKGSSGDGDPPSDSSGPGLTRRNAPLDDTSETVRLGSRRITNVTDDDKLFDGKYGWTPYLMDKLRTLLYHADEHVQFKRRVKRWVQERKIARTQEQDLAKTRSQVLKNAQKFLPEKFVKEWEAKFGTSRPLFISATPRLHDEHSEAVRIRRNQLMEFETRKRERNIQLYEQRIEESRKYRANRDVVEVARRWSTIVYAHAFLSTIREVVRQRSRIEFVLSAKDLGSPADRKGSGGIRDLDSLDSPAASGLTALFGYSGRADSSSDGGVGGSASVRHAFSLGENVLGGTPSVSLSQRAAALLSSATVQNVRQIINRRRRKTLVQQFVTTIYASMAAAKFLRKRRYADRIRQFLRAISVSGFNVLVLHQRVRQAVKRIQHFVRTFFQKRQGWMFLAELQWAHYEPQILRTYVPRTTGPLAAMMAGFEYRFQSVSAMQMLLAEEFDTPAESRSLSSICPLIVDRDTEGSSQSTSVGAGSSTTSTASNAAQQGTLSPFRPLGTTTPHASSSSSIASVPSLTGYRFQPHSQSRIDVLAATPAPPTSSRTIVGHGAAGGRTLLSQAMMRSSSRRLIGPAAEKDRAVRVEMNTIPARIRQAVLREYLNYTREEHRSRIRNWFLAKRENRRRHFQSVHTVSTESLVRFADDLIQPNSSNLDDQVRQFRRQRRHERRVRQLMQLDSEEERLKVNQEFDLEEEAEDLDGLLFRFRLLTLNELRVLITTAKNLCSKEQQRSSVPTSDATSSVPVSSGNV